MKKIENKIGLICLIVFILFTQFMQAQPPFEEEDVEDVPAAAIDDWVIPIGLLGIGVVYLLQKRELKDLK